MRDETRISEAGRHPAGDGTDSGRASILRAARTRFVTDGYAAASMAAIATDAGMTKAALYYHFPGKDALFVAVFADEVARLRSSVEHLVGAPSLRAALVALARLANEEAASGAMRLGDEFIRHVDPLVQESSGVDLDGPLHAVEAIVAAFADELRPGLEPAFVAECFLGLVTGRLQRGRSCGEGEPADPDVAVRLVDVFLDGVHPR
jgi:AcrR family transcriptional regulator